MFIQTSMESLKNPYACAFCQESFSESSSLVSHVQSKHETKDDTNDKGTEIQDSVNPLKGMNDSEHGYIY